MIADTEDRQKNRVVCVLDSSAESRSSLDIVARLAAESGGELAALFVEEFDLLDAAAFPAAQLISMGRRREPLDTNLLRRALSLSAQQAESELAQAGKRWRVQTSFKRVTAMTRESVAAEAKQWQLIALSQTRMRALSASAVGPESLFGSKSRCSFLLSRRAPRAHRPLAVVLENDDESGERIIDQALALAAAHRLPLRVYVATSNGAEEMDQTGPLRKLRAGNVSLARIVSLAGSDVASLESALAGEPASMLLLSRRGKIGGKVDPSDLLSKKLAATVLVTA